MSWWDELIVRAGGRASYDPGRPIGAFKSCPCGKAVLQWWQADVCVADVCRGGSSERSRDPVPAGPSHGASAWRPEPQPDPTGDFSPGATQFVPKESSALIITLELMPGASPRPEPKLAVLVGGVLCLEIAPNGERKEPRQVNTGPWIVRVERREDQ